MNGGALMAYCVVIELLFSSVSPLSNMLVSQISLLLCSLLTLGAIGVCARMCWKMI